MKEQMELVSKSEIEGIQERTSILETEAETLSCDITAPAEERAVQLKHLAEFFKLIGKEIKVLEEKRRAFTQGLVDSKRQIDNTFRDLAQPRQAAKLIIARKVKTMQDYEAQLTAEENDRIRRDNQAKIQAAAQANAIAEKHTPKGQTITPVVLPLEQTKVAPRAVRGRKKWSFEVETYVPELRFVVLDYLMENDKYTPLVDMAVRDLIRKAEAAGTIETLEINGVRVYEDETLVLR